MEIIILGSGTLSRSLKRTAAGIIINFGSNPLLLDCGSGIYYKLAHAGINIHDISHIFITHYEHPDHVNDLPYILFVKKYDNTDHTEDIILTGPPGITEFYGTIKKLYPILDELPFRLEIREMHDDKIAFNYFTAISKPMSHGDARASGYRFELKDNTIVYSGDTDYCSNLVELADNADVLIAECSYPDELKVPNHLSPGTAGRLAAEAGVRKLVLTHLYPECDNHDIKEQISKAYKGKTIIAYDMMRIDV